VVGADGVLRSFVRETTLRGAAAEDLFAGPGRTLLSQLPGATQVRPRARQQPGGMTQPTPNARDGALRRLRGLTVGAAGTALGAVAVFAAVAAATIPGHSTTAASGASSVATASGSTSSASSASSDASSSLQTTTAPQSSSSSSSSSHAATGGS
jgi:hypothetical protein